MNETKHFKRLIIASYRLPYKFAKVKDEVKAVQNSGGLVSAVLALSEKSFSKSSGQDNRIIWTGTAENMPRNLPKSGLKDASFEIVPVTIPSKLNDKFYGGFSNDLIWPLFHYFTFNTTYNIDYWEAYQEANRMFCQEIANVAEPGDLVWVHDYQLLLLPEMLSKAVNDISIGFFLHIPFPSFEIFRLLPRGWREAIVKGMLGADLVGFHTNDYAQNFIKSVKRTTGYECHQNKIYTPDKIVRADAFPIGIDYEKFSSACFEKPVIKEKLKIRKSLPDQKLIFSVDRLDYTKGFLPRLKGYETFLEKHPEWHSKVVFNMVVVPSRDFIDKYREMKKEIESVVGRINGKYSTLTWRPIIYQYKSLSFNELVALYDMSDVGLITPLRDGMNLVAKEYIACKQENMGVLILSEMAGAAAELNEAIIINPSDDMEISDAIRSALNMDNSEKKARIGRMQNRISSYNVVTWAYDFFEQIHEIKEQQKYMSVKIIKSSNISCILDDYQKAQNRILFLDYDGTLVSFARFPELAVIDNNTLEIIKRLNYDRKNRVIIISGRGKEFLEKQFREVPVTLVAEHGYFIKEPRKGWISTVNPDAQWKDSVKPILQEYVNRCNGTFIEEKTGSIAWHYRNADSDFAQLRLHELKDDLSDIIRQKTDFEILEGHKVLEVKCGKYDKGLAAGMLITEKYFDFILAAGDDKTDESIFQVMPDHAYTIRIGLTPSFAKFNVPEYSALIELLKSFVL